MTSQNSQLVERNGEPGLQIRDRILLRCMSPKLALNCRTLRCRTPSASGPEVGLGREDHPGT
jgi:hypothetical protein